MLSMELRGDPDLRYTNQEYAGRKENGNTGHVDGYIDLEARFNRAVQCVW